MNIPDKSVYLAGPITGLTHDQARFGWRQRIAEMLPSHVQCNSPMRGKEFLADIGVLQGDCSTYPDHAMATPQGITTRDFNDVKNCDAMLACYLESAGPSLGTAVEFGYAWTMQKPIIVVGPADDVNIKHGMLERMAGFRVDTLEEAAVILSHLLSPGL